MTSRATRRPLQLSGSMCTSCQRAPPRTSSFRRGTSRSSSSDRGSAHSTTSVNQLGKLVWEKRCGVTTTLTGIRSNFHEDNSTADGSRSLCYRTSNIDATQLPALQSVEHPTLLHLPHWLDFELVGFPKDSRARVVGLYFARGHL